MTILAPPPKFGVTFVNANGETRPGIGYKLYTYLAGSSTPKLTYHDITLGSPNTNPVVMDSRGECDLWLSGSYKFILKTDLDSTVWEVDEVRDPFTGQTLNNTTLTGTLTISSTSVTWSGNPTHSGNHIFSGNVTINGNTVIGNTSGDTLTIAPNTVTWSNSPTHSGNHTFSGTLSTSSTSIGISTGAIGPGTAFTPTSSDTVNCSVLPQTGGSNYIRIGNNALVWGIIQVDPTSANTLTSFYLTLPIASAFSSGLELAGGAVAGNPAVQNYSAMVTSVLPDNKAAFNFFCGTDVTSRFWTYWYAYTII